MSETSGESGAGAESRSFNSIAERFAFPGVVLLALVLRLWGIGREDLWYDEIATVKYLGEPSVGQFLTEMQAHNPPVQPLYPLLEYYWFHAAGASVIGLRLFSLLLIVPTLFLVRALGARLISERAGVIAAFVMAVSHVSIFYSLEVRMYALTLLLSVLSLYSLVRLADSGGRGWWILSGACTVLIVWTHILGVFFLVCQFAFVALHFGKAEWRKMAVWCGIQAAAVATILPWLLGADYEYIREQYVFRETPTFLGFHNLSVQRLYMEWIGPPPAALAPDSEVAFISYLGRVMVLLYAIAAAYLGRGLYTWLRTREDAGRNPFNRQLLIATVAAVPVFMLYLLSVLWEPSFFDRYVLVSLVGVALLAGFAVDAKAFERTRPWILGTLVLLMVTQAVTYLQTPARRPWTEANAVIAEVDAPKVTVRLYGGSSEIMMTEAEYHLAGENIESVQPYDDFEVMRDECLLGYDQQAPAGETERDMVIAFSTESAGHLLAYFKANDVAYDATVLRSRMPLICFELGKRQ